MKSMKQLKLGMNTFDLEFLNQQHIIELDIVHLAIICKQLIQRGYESVDFGWNYIEVNLTSDNQYSISTAITDIIDEILHGKHSDTYIHISVIMDNALSLIKKEIQGE